VKKILIILMVALFTAASFAQEGTFAINGEAKTGVIWEEVVNRNGTEVDTSKKQPPVRFGSKDDAGDFDGRFRINMEYTSPSGIMGFKGRLNWDNFNNPPTSGPNWTYGFGWGSFLNDQLVMSLGKLGASPWGTGGPEMWRELEIIAAAGIRFEFKPKFFEGHDINVGFVLNGTDGYTDASDNKDATLMDYLSETVVGASYKNKWFMARAAYRFDSPLDTGERTGGDPVDEGTKLVYRFEEYALRRLLPDLSLWALGFFEGLGSSAPDQTYKTSNWVFAQYAPSNFTAQMRFGFEATYARTVIFVKPSFSYKFFNGLLSPGIELGYANDFGKKIWPNSDYSYIELKPKLQVDFAPDAYVAFEYYYRLENKFGLPGPPEQETQWFNLRTGIKF